MSRKNPPPNANSSSNHTSTAFSNNTNDPNAQRTVHSLSNAAQQNELLDLFFDKLYSASWDSLDHLEFALKAVLKGSLRDPHTESTTRKLSASQRKIVKDAIDHFMETNVEPELKKCMDIFEIIMTDQVLPRVMQEATDVAPVPAAQQPAPNHTTKPSSQHAALSTMETLHDQDSLWQDDDTMRDTVNMEEIAKAREHLSISTQMLNVLKRQEAFVDRYAQHVHDMRTSLNDGTPAMFGSLENLRVKRAELQRIYSELNEFVDPNPLNDVDASMEDVEEHVEILGNTASRSRGPVSQEY